MTFGEPASEIIVDNSEWVKFKQLNVCVKCHQMRRLHFCKDVKYTISEINDILRRREGVLKPATIRKRRIIKHRGTVKNNTLRPYRKKNQSGKGL